MTKEMYLTLRWTLGEGLPRVSLWAVCGNYALVYSVSSQGSALGGILCFAVMLGKIWSWARRKLRRRAQKSKEGEEKCRSDLLFSSALGGRLCDVVRETKIRGKINGEEGSVRSSDKLEEGK